MKKNVIFGSAIIIILLFVLLFYENPSFLKRQPPICHTCGGTGKITSSENVQLPCEIIKFNVVDNGVFNPDYVAEVTVKNNGDKDGVFTIMIDFNYENIGTHTKEDELFVSAYSQNTCQIQYDADNYADDVNCRVKAPIVIKTKESICPTCNGVGFIK